MTHVCMFVLGCLMLISPAPAIAQNTTPDMLEQALAGVVTVALYKTSDIGNQPLGVRGSRLAFNSQIVIIQELYDST